MSLKRRLSRIFSLSRRERPPSIFGGIDVGGLFTEFGKNLPEDRVIDETLRNGIKLANSGNWEEAAKVFRSVLKKHPDYDVPHMWLADYLNQSEGPSKAVAALRDAAKRCRRKSELLAQAAELSLLERGDVMGAIHLLAQSIAAMEEKPGRRQYARQKACLLMREVFRSFDDYSGVRWAESMQREVVPDGRMINQIHRALVRIGPTERRMMELELPTIRDHLFGQFPL